MKSDVSDLKPEIFKSLPEVVKALAEPRKPRSILNYMCACDTADPVTVSYTQLRAHET